DVPFASKTPFQDRDGERAKFPPVLHRRITRSDGFRHRLAPDAKGKLLPAGQGGICARFTVQIFQGSADDLRGKMRELDRRTELLTPGNGRNRQGEAW